MLLCQSVDSVGERGEVEWGDQIRGFGRSPGERTVAGTRAVTVEAEVDESDTFAAGAIGAFCGLAVGSENLRVTPGFAGRAPAGVWR